MIRHPHLMVVRSRTGWCYHAVGPGFRPLCNHEPFAGNTRPVVSWVPVYRSLNGHTLLPMHTRLEGGYWPCTRCFGRAPQYKKLSTLLTDPSFRANIVDAE